MRMVCLLQESLLSEGERMNNTTTNQTSNATGNSTATDTITDTLLDLLGTNQEALLIVGVATAASSYAYYRVPLVRQYADTYLPIIYIRTLVAKFLKKHGTEVDELIDANLTKVQKTAFNKLDAQLQKSVKDKVLKDVILSTYDQHDDKMKNQVRNDIRSALAEARGESK